MVSCEEKYINVYEHSIITSGTSRTLHRTALGGPNSLNLNLCHQVEKKGIETIKNYLLHTPNPTTKVYIMYTRSLPHTAF